MTPVVVIAPGKIVAAAFEIVAPPLAPAFVEEAVRVQLADNKARSSVTVTGPKAAEMVDPAVTTPRLAVAGALTDKAD
jgi:hypothetical protein